MSVLSRYLDYLPGGLSPALRAWLQEPSSLTRRCQQQFDEFLVQPVFQGHRFSLLEAGSRYGSQFPNQLAMVREVLLVVDGKPFIFAHSVLKGEKRGPLSSWLSGLGVVLWEPCCFGTLVSGEEG
jgi:chorismate-pyruvate lyase